MSSSQATKESRQVRRQRERDEAKLSKIRLHEAVPKPAAGFKRIVSTMPKDESTKVDVNKVIALKQWRAKCPRARNRPAYARMERI